MPQIDSLIHTTEPYSETEQERQERYESLAQTSLIRDEVADSAQQVEDQLFPLQSQAMTIFGSAFSESRLK